MPKVQITATFHARPDRLQYLRNVVRASLHHYLSADAEVTATEVPDEATIEHAADLAASAEENGPARGLAGIIPTHPDHDAPPPTSTGPGRFPPARITAAADSIHAWLNSPADGSCPPLDALRTVADWIAYWALGVPPTEERTAPAPTPDTGDTPGDDTTPDDAALTERLQEAMRDFASHPLVMLPDDVQQMPVGTIGLVTPDGTAWLLDHREGYATDWGGADNPMTELERMLWSTRLLWWGHQLAVQEDER